MDRETLRKLKQKSHSLFKCILCVFFTSCFSIPSISRLVPLHPLHLAGGHSRTNTVSAGGGEPAPKLLLWEGCSHLPPGRPILQVPRHSSFFCVCVSTSIPSAASADEPRYIPKRSIPPFGLTWKFPKQGDRIPVIRITRQLGFYCWPLVLIVAIILVSGA